MDYYDITPKNIRDLDTDILRPHGITVIISGYDHVAAGTIEKEDQDFQDKCRRQLYAMGTIKKGFKVHTQLDMIRIEKTVQMLAYLQHNVGSDIVIRADQHILKRIYLHELLEMFQEDITAAPLPHYVEMSKHRLRSALENIQRKEECECYILANQGELFSEAAIKHKYYFIHNVVARHTIIISYQETRPSDSSSEWDIGDDIEWGTGDEVEAEE